MGNGPGAMALNAKPDGYTVAQFPMGMLRIPHMQKTAWHPINDFSFIIGLSGYTFGFVVRADSPFKTFNDYIEAARKQPGKIDFGSTGVGTSPHLLIEEVADIAKVGPIRGQADSITRMLRARSTLVHIVTLLEEMPVQETVDAVREIGDAGFGLGALVVNLEREPMLDEAARKEVQTSADAALEDRVRGELVEAGIRPTGPMVRGLLSEARDHVARLDLEDELRAEIAAQDLPVLHLPRVAAGVEAGGLRVLARSLAEQGVA